MVVTRRKQSLDAAVRAVREGRIRLTCGLAGCPEGGWPETQQAMRRLAEELPMRDARSYHVSDLVYRIYEVDSAGRYRVRAEVLS